MVFWLHHSLHFLLLFPSPLEALGASGVTGLRKAPAQFDSALGNISFNHHWPQGSIFHHDLLYRNIIFNPNTTSLLNSIPMSHHFDFFTTKTERGLLIWWSVGKKSWGSNRFYNILDCNLHFSLQNNLLMLFLVMLWNFSHHLELYFPRIIIK